MSDEFCNKFPAITANMEFYFKPILEIMLYHFRHYVTTVQLYYHVFIRGPHERLVLVNKCATLFR